MDSERNRTAGRPSLASRGRLPVAETLLFLAAVVTCGVFLIGGFGEAGSFHLASAFN